jgi:hypothetical protein
MENTFAVKLNEWKGEMILKKRFKVPTGWLKGKHHLNIIPKARPLNYEWVEDMANSFSKLQDRNKEVLMCLWGVPREMVQDCQGDGRGL